MKLEKPAFLSATVVIVLTLIAEVPAVNHWIKDAMNTHSNLTVFVEGLIGLILVFIAGNKATPEVKK
jgi:hypothetical protein